jgi:hypothetical protein
VQQTSTDEKARKHVVAKGAEEEIVFSFQITFLGSDRAESFRLNVEALRKFIDFIIVGILAHAI